VKAPTRARIVPAGVTRVPWRFVCPPGPAARCRQQPPATVTVPVRGNVAAASVPGTDEMCDRSQCQCRRPVVITWYRRHGRVVASHSPAPTVRTIAIRALRSPPADRHDADAAYAIELARRDAQSARLASRSCRIVVAAAVGGSLCRELLLRWC